MFNTHLYPIHFLSINANSYFNYSTGSDKTFYHFTVFSFNFQFQHIINFKHNFSLKLIFITHISTTFQTPLSFVNPQTPHNNTTTPPPFFIIYNLKTFNLTKTRLSRSHTIINNLFFNIHLCITYSFY